MPREKMDYRLLPPESRAIILEVHRQYRLARMRVTQKPFTGPYYWVPLRDTKWKLYEFADHYYKEKHAAHVIIWREVVDNLALEWRVNPDALQRVLENAPYGLPRGRVVKLGDDKWGIAHGDDNPAGTSLQMVKKAFNLPRKKTTLFLDEHEHVIPEHVQLVRETLNATYTIATPPDPFADEWDDE